MPPLVVLDANVLYPAALRDVFMWLSATKAIRAHWTSEIHEEWMRNVEKDRGIPRKELEKIRHLMDSHTDDALVDDFARLERRFRKTDSKDRHVAAAALKVSIDNDNAPVSVVTFNTKDFDSDELASLGLTKTKPDTFLKNLFARDPAAVISAIRAQRANLKNPPMTALETLAMLERQGLPQFAGLLKAHLKDI